MSFSASDIYFPPFYNQAHLSSPTSTSPPDLPAASSLTHTNVFLEHIRHREVGDRLENRDGRKVMPAFSFLQ